jgi:hypothetical protein
MNLRFLTGSRRISLKLVWINIAVSLAAFNAAADTAFISVPLERSGRDPNAGGVVTIDLARTTSSMMVQATNLTPGRTYTVSSGGEVRGTFVANRNGRGQLKFAQPAASGVLPFNFDPRGRQLVIAQRQIQVLSARISGPGEPSGSIVNEQVTIPRVPGATAGTASATYGLSADGTRSFSVTLTNVADGNWTLFVDGIRRGIIAVSGGTGRLAFDNVADTPAPALNFDPRGAVIDLSRGGTLRFSGRFAARANGINAAIPSLQTRHVPGVDETPVGFARVQRWTDRDARRGVDVEIADVPAGDYELFINGVFQGFVPVVTGPTGTFGEMKFTTEPNDEEERLLRFNAFSSSFVIQQLGTLFFVGQAIAGDFGDTEAGTLVPVQFVLPLFNLGADANGVARAEFKRDDRGSRRLKVVLRNVPVGTYSLTLDGELIGTIEVIRGANGTHGAIEFEDEPEVGENLLPVDPLGKTLGVQRGGSIRYFERTLPATP